MKVTSEELRKRERAGWTTASQANGATRKQLRTTTQRLERTAWWPRQCRSPGYRMTETAAPSKRFRELPGQLGGKRIGGNGRGPSNSYFEGPRSFRCELEVFSRRCGHIRPHQNWSFDPQDVDSTARRDHFLWKIKKL